jgi:uncharacterized protein (DUF362 family)
LDAGYRNAIAKALEYIGAMKHVRPGATVFIKPNLTYPFYKEGVMTSPECIDAAVSLFCELGAHVIVAESDGGGYNRFPMDEVYEKTGIKEMAERQGVELVNLTKMPSLNIHFQYRGRNFSVPLPEILLDGVDLFLTIPVPKMHSNTQVSMSIKNQWGCIQEPSLRLKLHPYFRKTINEINRAIGARYSIIDGRFGLNRNGPMRGEVEHLNWLMAGDNLLAVDRACSRVIGVDPHQISYLCEYKDEQANIPIDQYQYNCDWRDYQGPKFYLQREFWDYPGFFAFRSSFLAYLAYHSPFSKILHKALYLFRKKFYDHD